MHVCTLLQVCSVLSAQVKGLFARWPCFRNWQNYMCIRTGCTFHGALKIRSQNFLVHLVITELPDWSCHFISVVMYWICGTLCITPLQYLWYCLYVFINITRYFCNLIKTCSVNITKYFCNLTNIFLLTLQCISVVLYIHILLNLEGISVSYKHMFC